MDDSIARRTWDRWGPVAVLSVVVMVSNALAALWVADRIGDRIPSGPGGGATATFGGAPPPEGARGPADAVPDGDPAPALATVEEGVFSPALEEHLQRVAQAQGLDPDTLPAPRVMYAEMEDRGVLLPTGRLLVELRRFAPSEAAAIETGRALGLPEGEAPTPAAVYVWSALTLNVFAKAQAGREGATVVDPAPPGDAPPPGADSIAMLDDLLAKRIVKQSGEKGIDPGTLMPDAAMREAAVASKRVDSPEAQALLQAYSAAFERLNAAPAP